MNTNLFESFVNHPVVVSVGWMLVHFVWQAALIAAIVALALAMLRRQTASTRYNVACTSLAIMTIIPIATLGWLIANTDPADWKARAVPAPQSMAMATADPALEKNVTRLIAPPGQVVVDHESEEIAIAAALSWSEKLELTSRSLQGWLPWCVFAWIAGVVCLAMRLLIGLNRIWSWRRDGVFISDGRLADAVKRLSTVRKLTDRFCPSKNRFLKSAWAIGNRTNREKKSKPVDFSFQRLFLTLNGNGVNWKTALQEAVGKPLELTWEGLSTETTVSASMAFLELGEKKRE